MMTVIINNLNQQQQKVETNYLLSARTLKVQISFQSWASLSWWTLLLALIVSITMAKLMSTFQPPAVATPAAFTIVWTRPNMYMNGEPLPVYFNNANNNEIEIPVAVRTTQLATYTAAYNRPPPNNFIIDGRNETMANFTAAHPNGRYLTYEKDHFRYLPTHYITNKRLKLAQGAETRAKTHLAAVPVKLPHEPNHPHDKRIRRFHDLNTICYLDPRFFDDGQILPLVLLQDQPQRLVPVAVSNTFQLPDDFVAMVKVPPIPIQDFWPAFDK